MVSGHNQGQIDPTPTAPTSWGPELSYKTIRYPITLLQIVKIAAKVKHLWKVKLMKNQKMLNLCKNRFYHWNQGSMDFQIKCRSNKISKMSKFKKLVGNSPIFCETYHNIYYSYKHSELPIIIKLTFFPGSFCFLSGTNNQKIRKSSTRIFSKNHIFPGQCPQCATISSMCNTFLGTLGVAHWLRPVYLNMQFEFKNHYEIFSL